MSVLDSIDTTVTLEWTGRRTIGTLVEIDGYSAVITALNAPSEGSSITVTVEGDTADEAIAMDGICTTINETAWGEQRIELELMRIGTTCSASRLRDFVEEYGVASGGSVHIGASRANPGQRRFVYHVPERVDHADAAITKSGSIAIGPDFRATVPNERTSATRPTAAVEISEALDERRRSFVRTAHDFGRPLAPTARTGETLPAGSHVFTTDMVAASALAGDDDLTVDFELGIDDLPEKTINSDLAAGAFITGGSLDEAFREALRAVDRPKLPTQKPEVSRRRSSLMRSSPDIAMDAVPIDSELGRPVLPDDDIEPTRMMDAIGDDTDAAVADAEEDDFTKTDLSFDDVTRLKAAIDDAIAHERDVSDSEYHDPNEPIIVNTVSHTVPFADPVQLGADNRAPTMAQVAPTPSPEAEAKAEAQEKAKAQEQAKAQAQTADESARPPETVSRNRLSTARIERVAPSLVGSLRAPKSKKDDEKPQGRKASGSLERIQNLFNVDMAIRCDLPATFQIGKKKYSGQLIRLAESRLRVQSDKKQPQLYQRIKVMLEPVDGGKNKITLECEVTRVRETHDGEMVAFDMRLSAGTNPPKQMQALRLLMRSFEAPSSHPPAEATA